MRTGVPGTVWAADFTQAPLPIDGRFDYILLIRDLPSRLILLAAPSAAQDADAVTFHCRQLFLRHDPPLVLKTDNGSPFIAAPTRDLCARHGVLNLLSPPLTPRYNGSVEATGGQLKTHAALIARQRPCDDDHDAWTSDLLEAARLCINALGSGGMAPTPDERWLGRSPIEQRQRAALAALVAQLTNDITQSIQRKRRLDGLATEIPAACAAAVARTAISQALQELGYLQVRRPMITSTENNAVSSKN
jgi:hypothetical protein